ncbi:MAG: hypothetical protein AMXMBFR84_03440 [Candidatus Hydrogenedentota bacterium]
MTKDIHTRVRQFYEQNPQMVSSPFGGTTGINESLFHDVLSRLRIDLRGKRVIDVGCGRAFVGDLVAAMGGHYTGVDLVVSRSGVRMAQAQAQRLPFPNGAFDVVFCIDAFEHFPDPPAAMAEFRRVMAADGVFFLSAPNYGNVAGLVKRVYESLGWYAKDTWAPFGRWQPQELEQPLTIGAVRRWARQAGFRDVMCAGHALEVELGLFPWIAHPKMPESLLYRLQRVFRVVGPSIVRAWPGSSLHVFYRIGA